MAVVTSHTTATPSPSPVSPRDRAGFDDAVRTRRSPPVRGRTAPCHLLVGRRRRAPGPRGVGEWAAVSGPAQRSGGLLPVAGAGHPDGPSARSRARVRSGPSGAAAPHRRFHLVHFDAGARGADLLGVRRWTSRWDRLVVLEPDLHLPGHAPGRRRHRLPVDGRAHECAGARRRLRYEGWHLLHLYAYLGVGLALPHQLWTGQQFLASNAETAFWWTVWAAAAAAVVVWRVALPVVRNLRHDIKVVQVVREGPRRGVGAPHGPAARQAARRGRSVHDVAVPRCPGLDARSPLFLVCDARAARSPGDSSGGRRRQCGSGEGPPRESRTLRGAVWTAVRASPHSRQGAPDGLGCGHHPAARARRRA